MKKLIVMIGLSLVFSVLAQDQLEPSWKTKTREIVSSIAGARWGEKLLGPTPVSPNTSNLTLPAIPQQVKKNTDISSYTKQQKPPTEFDKLKDERKRQFNYAFIKELFWVTRKAAAKDEDLSNWINTLDQGGSREGIYQALVLDEVYSALENMEESPTPKLQNFTLNFSQKFLNQTFNKEALTKLNLYSLKRILTEKSLDLLEFYEVKDLDLIYRWYAILSSDFGADYAPFFQTPIRQNASADFHYEWAKGMPIQQIKSEFIIKLHTVMNGLQLL